MNILFISKLSGNLWAGPNNSVPAQVKAQSEFDNCFWYNLNNVKRDEWQVDGLDCKNYTDIPSGRLKDLPVPFNKMLKDKKENLEIKENKENQELADEISHLTDKNVELEKIIADLIKNKIPYVIVPRSTLTIKAQNNKRAKKIIGNILWFNRMIKHASAVQYLTLAEKSESEEQWNVPSNIIPNGTELSDKKNTISDKGQIRALYIGRIDIYQKGFDILLEALNKTQDKLRNIGFHLDAYGPNREDAYTSIFQMMESYGVSDLISFHDAVFKDEKKEKLQNSDLFIMASRFEGMPMGLIEALSYGIPCVITEGTNLSDIVRKYDAGWTADNNYESLASALLKMVYERDRLTVKGNQAYLLSEEFGWKTIAQKTHQWLLNIVKATNKEQNPS